MSEDHCGGDLCRSTGRTVNATSPEAGRFRTCECFCAGCCRFRENEILVAAGIWRRFCRAPAIDDEQEKYLRALGELLDVRDAALARAMRGSS